MWLYRYKVKPKGLSVHTLLQFKNRIYGTMWRDVQSSETKVVRPRTAYER